ncbi:recombinase family protein [Micromonospora sp. NPDC047753]|uniref:recombinase family protein n=1 Tax=Micromonospora sp. NPDC047753 TaxID=3154817 RepID=UPI0033C6404E
MPLRAAVYCRISLARFDDTLKVDDQERVCRELAAARGWTVAPAHVFKDNSKSAWRRDRKRPGWEAMLAAVKAGEVDAIVVYHGDRLVRQMTDLEALIDLADTKGIRLASPTGERDLDNADDRYILRIEAAGNTREVDATSRRLKRHYERLAEQGITRLGGRGGRAYGFEPDGLTIREADKAVIQEVARRVLAREPMGAIVRSLNDRGIRTVTGALWDHSNMRRVLTKPRMAGLLERRGEIVGEAAWPAILDRETWQTVRDVLGQKASTFTYITHARTHLLSGIPRCGPCGEPLAPRQNARGKHLLGYGCITPGCRKTHRAMHHLDAYVIGATLALLADGRVRKRMQPTTKNTAPLTAEMNKLAQRREQVIADFGDDDEMGADVLRLSVRRIDKRLGELRAEIEAAQTPSLLAGLWNIDRAGWDALELHRRRAAISALLRITVWPSQKRGPGFDPSSVELTPV